jgi:hypothetical protein
MTSCTWGDMTQWAVFSAKTLGIKKSFPLGMGRNSEEKWQPSEIPAKIDSINCNHLIVNESNYLPEILGVILFSSFFFLV